MTKTTLRKNIIFIITILILFIISSGIMKFYFNSDNLYLFVKDFSSIIIAISAAYLAYCFQRRQAFLVSLRDLWKELVEAKGELVEYTYMHEPDQAAFNKAHRALSRAIDTVRGVYRNVGESDDDIGLYPFETLHDMRKTLDQLGWTNATVDEQKKAREHFIRSWNALRWAFLKEFSTPEPAHPIVTRNASDPRRANYRDRQIWK